MKPAELRVPILNALHVALKPQGFIKRGTLFSRGVADVIHLIELQSSKSNVSGAASFTVNLAVFMPAAVYEDVRATTKPSVPASHWRQRIGALEETHMDKWWNVTSSAEALEAGDAIVQAVTCKALPLLSSLSDSGALLELWRSGSSPGLTATTRQDLLARLSVRRPVSAA